MCSGSKMHMGLCSSLCFFETKIAMVCNAYVANPSNSFYQANCVRMNMAFIWICQANRARMNKTFRWIWPWSVGVELRKIIDFNMINDNLPPCNIDKLADSHSIQLGACWA